MNFDEINKVSTYVRTEILPHLACRMHFPDFGTYLSKLSFLPSFEWMEEELKLIPINYFVDPSTFTERYEKKCVTYIGTSNPQDGAMHVIYQISLNVHVLARLYHWVEHGKVRSYFMLVCAYRNHEDYLKFFDEILPLRLSGDTEEKQMGFAGLMQRSSGVDDIIKKFLPSGTTSVLAEEKNEDEEIA